MTKEQRWQKAEKLYHKKGAHQQGTEVFQQLVSQYPDHAEGWFYLSSLAYSVKRYDLAFTTMERAVKLEGENTRWLESKAVQLSLLQACTNEGQKYMDRATEQWFTVTYYGGEINLE